MNIEDVKREYTSGENIQALMNVESFYGDSKDSKKGLMLTIMLCSIPIFGFYPAWIFLSNFMHFMYSALILVAVYLVYVWNVIAHVMLHQTERVQDYRSAERSAYELMGKYIGFSSIDENSVSYPSKRMIIIRATNGSQDNSIKYLRVKEFLDTLYEFDGLEYEVRVRNSSSSLEDFSKLYKSIRSFKDKETAKQVIDMLREIGVSTKHNTRFLEILYCIKVDKDKADYYFNKIKSALPEKAYYTCTILDADDIQKRIEEDLGVDIDRDEIYISYQSSDYMKKSRLISKRAVSKEEEKENKLQRRRI